MVPHPKEGDHEVANNNRPISLLPVLSKVAERIAMRQFNDYLDITQPIDETSKWKSIFALNGNVKLVSNRRHL